MRQQAGFLKHIAQGALVRGQAHIVCIVLPHLMAQLHHATRRGKLATCNPFPVATGIFLVLDHDARKTADRAGPKANEDRAVIIGEALEIAMERAARLCRARFREQLLHRRADVLGPDLVVRIHEPKSQSMARIRRAILLLAAAAPATPFYFYDIPSMTGVSLPMPEFIGLAEQFGSVYMPTYAVVLTFVIMAGVLAVRPQGLLGRPA